MPSVEEGSHSGFRTAEEPHPVEIVTGGAINNQLSIQDLRTAIPVHCFQPSYFWSFFYLFRDLTYSALLLYLFTQIPTLSSFPKYEIVRYSLLLIYGFVQGLVWTGLWILAHECGHSAFAPSSLLNDTISFILHSFLLAPYFSWKSTHRRHHIYANHLARDLNYVPPLRSTYATALGLQLGQLEELGEDVPLVLFLRIVLQQLIGWNWYILTNITAPPTSLVKEGMSAWRHSHFDPWGALFWHSEVVAVLLSDAGCAATIAGLWNVYRWTGSFELVFWGYVVPWCWVNHWIVMITYLHHTHPSIPKYSPGDWTFILGATATMDRYFSPPFSLIGTHFFHHISTDHVVHHLFSKIPHYYAREATQAIIPLLGPLYKRGAFGWASGRLRLRNVSGLRAMRGWMRDILVGRRVERRTWRRGCGIVVA